MQGKFTHTTHFYKMKNFTINLDKRGEYCGIYLYNNMSTTNTTTYIGVSPSNNATVYRKKMSDDYMYWVDEQDYNVSNYQSFIQSNGWISFSNNEGIAVIGGNNETTDK